ncbi:MAG: glycine betaine ABC transporter substrate-binding protein, partial [Dehalococcoidia bacterium]|nr:glycine betaine ABC transporter substrate-binding protein [Dehalococcoidia bacterium]
MKRHAVIMLSFLVLLTLAAASACATSGGNTSKGSVVVASKIDTEGALLSQFIILMLRANGIDAVDKSQFGTTQLVRKALLSGEIDVYPEYTGNGEYFFEGTDPTIWKDAAKG